MTNDYEGECAVVWINACKTRPYRLYVQAAYYSPYVHLLLEVAEVAETLQRSYM